MSACFRGLFDDDGNPLRDHDAGGSRSAQLIETVVADLPLRSLTVRAGSCYLFGNKLRLVSDTLESLIVTGSKDAYVSSYQCPKLKTLLLEYLFCFDIEDDIWDALQAGVHSLDLTTMPAGHKHDWFRFGFKDSVFGDSDRRHCGLDHSDRTW